MSEGKSLKRGEAPEKEEAITASNQSREKGMESMGDRPTFRGGHAKKARRRRTLPKKRLIGVDSRRKKVRGLPEEKKRRGAISSVAAWRWGGVG